MDHRRKTQGSKQSPKRKDRKGATRKVAVVDEGNEQDATVKDDRSTVSSIPIADPWMLLRLAIKFVCTLNNRALQYSRALQYVSYVVYYCLLIRIRTRTQIH